MSEIVLPVTREKVRALAGDWADDPDSVGEVVHHASPE